MSRIALFLFLSLEGSMNGQAATQSKPQSPAEEYVITSLRKDGKADLRNQKERTISARFLQAILFNTPETEIPFLRLQIRGAKVQGSLDWPGGQQSSVKRNITLAESALENVNLAGSTFDRDLELLNSTFLALNLDGVHIGRDLDLENLRSKNGGPLRVGLRRAKVDRDFSITNITSLLARGIVARRVDLDPSKDEKDKSLDFSEAQLEVLYLGAKNTKTYLEDLRLHGAVIKDELIMRNVEVGKLDVSMANLGRFEWKMSPCERQDGGVCWPEKIVVDGASYRELRIGPSEVGVDPREPDPDLVLPPPTDDSKFSLQFLDHAVFSDSAYTAYEASLRTHGMSARADDVYDAMRARRRGEAWHERNGALASLRAVFSYVLDLAQQVFLGYGRSALQPLLWSLGFVILGTIVFWTKSRMEPIGEHPPRFSAFWYSLELFLPVVDLGVAKNWRPQGSVLRITYARVHQIAGWILIPVALAAITGVFK